jgi:hypothetical protein
MKLVRLKQDLHGFRSSRTLDSGTEQALGLGHAEADADVGNEGRP